MLSYKLVRDNINSIVLINDNNGPQVCLSLELTSLMHIVANNVSYGTTRGSISCLLLMYLSSNHTQQSSLRTRNRNEKWSSAFSAFSASSFSLVVRI
jgi:hypothetical protein